MTSAITEEKLEQVLAQWDKLAYFAYDRYLRCGRGVIAAEGTANLEPDKLGVTLKYVIYDYQDNKPDTRVAQLIWTYDPDWEFLIQYLSNTGQIHTCRLRTAEGARHPKRVWFFETLGML